MNVVNWQRAGSGDGTNPYDAASSWALGLGFVPTPGNTLLLHLGLVNGININYIYCGASLMSYVYYGGTTNAGILVAAITVPSPAPSSLNILFNSGGFEFTSLIQEVNGITSLTVDQSSHASASGDVYNTGTTAATSQRAEYWCNSYCYYNASTGNDPVGSSPSNGYTLFSSTPVKMQDVGWSWAIGTPTSSAPAISAGLLLSYKFVTAVGTAGGSVSDSNLITNTNYGAALTFPGPSGLVLADQCVLANTMPFGQNTIF